MRGWLTLLVTLCAVAGCTREAGPTGDVVLHRVIRVGSAPEADAGVVYWGARTRVSDDRQKRLIFDLDARTITFVDKKTRTYIVRTLDELVGKHDRQRQARGSATGKIVLARTDKTERIAGYEARQYTFVTPVAHGSVWVSHAVCPSPAWHEWEALIAHLDGGFAGGDKISEAVAELDGYPLRTVLTFGDNTGALTVTTQIADIASGPPAEDLTRIPDYFRRANDFPIPTG